jgi:tetratricopeptide (TPR) repeat protein
VGQLRDAFDAQLLDEADDRVVFRHQLVHDAIYQHVPASARRLLHREAAVALMAAGADPLAVAEHLILGAERGDVEAAAWLRAAAGAASGQAPPVTVELLRHAETLLPDGHVDADRVSSEVVQALLRAGQVAEASARAEALLARPHAAEVDLPVRLALLGALALQNRAVELIAVAQSRLDGADLRPWELVPMLAQQSWAWTYTGDPREGESAAGRALAIAERADDAAMTVWALTALLVAVGRQGRFDEALAHARRAAALAAAAHDARSLPLNPKLFLGLTLFDCDLVDDARAAFRAALDDEFGSGWWLSDALMADAQASFVLGEWDDADPALIAGGLAARDKDRELLVAQSLAYRTVIATGRGDLAVATELAAGIAPSPRDDAPSYNEGIRAFAVAGLEEARGDARAAYEVLLRCWRIDAGRGSRYYHRCLAPGLVRLALALGQRDLAAEVASVVAEGVPLAPNVPSVRSLALRCRGLVDGDAEPLLEAVALARRTPLLVENGGACEDAASVLARDGSVGEAAALLEEALARYELSGAEAWARRVRCSCGSSASIRLRGDRGTGRRAAGTASPGRSRRCPGWWRRG